MTDISSLLQLLHSFIFKDIFSGTRVPHFLHTAHAYLSERSIILSCINIEIP